ncbi:MAG: hypothetical protein J0I32_05920 [Sphingobacteriales bacterium]|nr:hypothetical protein [Sphingobacteriales bacterium]OJW03895.1 MAG: hypothetical protein BGO52_17245 [Sphingobacteriales bacterium 44-61]
MSYQIFDTGSSLRFVNDDGFFYLMKHHIRSIRYVPDNLLRIDTGCCMHSIYIQADHVTQPANWGAEDLASILNNWMTLFLQGYPPDITPPVE